MITVSRLNLRNDLTLFEKKKITLPPSASSLMIVTFCVYVDRCFSIGFRRHDVSCCNRAGIGASDVNPPGSSRDVSPYFEYFSPLSLFSRGIINGCFYCLLFFMRPSIMVFFFSPFCFNSFRALEFSLCSSFLHGCFVLLRRTPRLPGALMIPLGTLAPAEASWGV